MNNRSVSVDSIRILFTRNSKLFSRAIIFISLLIFIIFVTQIIPERYWGLIPVFIIGIGGLLAIMRQPPLGLVALIGTIIIPINGPSNSNATLALVATLLGLWLLDMVVRQRKLQLLASPAIKPLLALIIVAVLAFGVGQLPWFNFAQHAPLGAQLGGLAIFILSAGAFFLMAHQIHDQQWLERITWFFIFLGGLFILGVIFPLIGRYTSRLFTGNATGSMFWAWFVAMSTSQVIFNRDLPAYQRLTLGGFVLATLYVSTVIQQEWKSGWIPSLVCFSIIIGFRFLKVAIAFIIPILILIPSVISSLITGDQYSYSTRLDAWNILIEIIKVNPLLGLGPANYHWYTPLFSIRGYYVRFNSHNQYVDIVAQTGLLGLACFLWFFWEVTKLGWRLRTRVPPGFAQAYVYGVLGGLAGTLVAGMLGDWILPFFYNITLGGFRGSVLPWLFMGGLVSLKQITQQSNDEKLTNKRRIY